MISGHHTGAFGGKRAKGSLSINFLEKLSCEPKYKKFFEGVKSLWLQGCRTMGADFGDLADDHVIRVGQVLEEDHLIQNGEALGIEFSQTLNQR